MTGTLPATVGRLLTESEWKKTDGFSVFDFVFRDRPRRASPSHYLVRVGETQPGFDRSGFTHEEAAALVAEGTLRGLAVDHGSHVSINEHAQHALLDFLSETADLWQKFQGRLGEIERSGSVG